MSIKITIFLIIAAGVFYLIHLPVYISIIKLFNITDIKAKRWIMFIIILLALSFFVANLLIRWRENALTTWLYIGGSVWIGILINLLLFIALGWTAIWLLKFFSININYKIIGLIIFVFSLLFSAYGVWNAKNLIIKKIEIKIDNIPEAWENIKAIQISDTHFGYINEEKYINKIIEISNQEKPDIIFITGDLLDDARQDINSITKYFNNLHAPLGIYFITGNHETFIGTNKLMSSMEKAEQYVKIANPEYFLSNLKDTKIKILYNQIIEINDMQIVGLDYEAAKNKEKVEKLFKKIEQSKPSILLQHEPINLELANNYNIDFMLSGHTHLGQIFPLRFFTRLIYGKYHYGLNNFGNLKIYTSNGAGTWGPPMRTLNKPSLTVINFK